MLTTVGQQTVTYQEVFPAGQPLKSLYALYAIQEYLNTQGCLTSSNSEEGTHERALLRALDLIVCAICDREVVNKGSGAELKIVLALRSVELLLAILRGMQCYPYLYFGGWLTIADPLRASPLPKVLNYLLVERLLEILSSCFRTEPTPSSANLLNATFQAILDTCSLDLELWNKLCSQADIKLLAQKLLLDDSRDVVRKSAARVIGERTTLSFRYVSSDLV